MYFVEVPLRRGGVLVTGRVSVLNTVRFVGTCTILCLLYLLPIPAYNPRL